MSNPLTLVVENFRLAIQSLTANALRSLLSMLGIIIGVASVIAITTMGNSATLSIQREIASTGLETLSISPRGFSRRLTTRFTTDFAEDVLTHFPQVEYALPQSSSSMYIRVGHEEWSGTTQAVLPEYADVYDYQATEGSFISQNNIDGADMVIVLGTDVAEELFPDGNAVGNYVRSFIGPTSRSFRVIGVMESHSAGFGQTFDSLVYIPFSTYAQRFSGSDQVGSYTLSIREGGDILELADEMEDFLTLRFGEDVFRVYSPSTIAEAAANVSTTLNIVLTGIAAISLLVGGIGIMNIMLVAVAERTREIGIRKALGARPLHIRIQFLVEAASITLTGGVLGMLGGLGISWFAVSALGWEFIPSAAAIVTAVLFSAGMGIFFGYYPAHRASMLDPIIALNYD